jgi:hypothetical protein
MTNQELKSRLEPIRQQLNADLRICRASQFEQVASDGGLYVHTDSNLYNMIMVTTDYSYQAMNCTMGTLIVEGWIVFVTQPVEDSLTLLCNLIGTTDKLYNGQIEISNCLLDLPAELAVDHAYNVSVVSLRVSLRSDLLEPNCYKVCYE